MLKDFFDESGKRIYLIKRLVSLFFLIGIIFSFKLWHADRLFPLAPVFGFLPEFAPAAGKFLAFALPAALIANCFIHKRTINSFVLVIVLLLALQDQNRWQPWVYIYTLCLLPFSVLNKEQTSVSELLTYYQLLLLGVYFWSGVHKVNANFIDITFKQILTDLFKIEKPELLQSLKHWGYAIPALEILTAFLLLIPKSRKAGVYLATATHLFILIYLSPFGVNDNYIVYPWNLAMIGLVFLAFYGLKGSVTLPAKEMKVTILNLFIALVTCLLPVLNFFGYLDNYLAFSLYSEKINEYYIIVEESALDKTSKALSPYYLKDENLRGGQIIQVNKWAMDEMNVPFYPETRVFKRVASSFCDLGIEEGKLFFLEFEKPLDKGKFNRFTCQDLE